MNVKTEIRSYLLDQSDVTDLVARRIRLRRLPQKGDYPQVTVWEISALRERDLTGPSGLKEWRGQIDIWTLGEADAGPIDDALRLALEGDKNTDPPWYATKAIGGLTVQELEYDDGIDDVVKPVHGSDQEVFRTARELTLWIEE